MLRAPSGPNFGPYWTFISAATLVMFLIYTASNGLLTRWLALFFYSKPIVVTQSEQSTATGPIASKAEVLANPANAFTGGKVSTPLDSKTFGTFGQGLF